MADTIDLDGEKFVSPSFVTSATSLDDIYTACGRLQGSTTAYNPSWPSTDDSATLLPIPPLWTGGADRLVVSTECGVEIVPYQFTSASTHYSQAIAGVSRYYSINCGCAWRLSSTRLVSTQVLPAFGQLQRRPGAISRHA